MLSLIGDILNLAALGILFPISLLPLAAIFQGASKTRGAVAWAIIAATIVGAGILFVALAPRLNQPNEMHIEFLGWSALIAVVFSVAVFAHGPRLLAGRLARAFSSIVKAAGRGVMWLLLAMAFVQFAVVLMRYVFGVNFIFMQESITYMHGFVFLLAAGYALLTDDHVRVDIFFRNAPPRRKALIELVGSYLFLLPVCFVVIWTASPYVARSWLVMEGSPDASGIQGVFVLKSLIPAFATLLVMAGFVIAERAAATLSGRR